MALNNLRNLVNEKAARAAEAEKERERVESEKQQAHLDYQKERLPAFYSLLNLENYFWECVNDFSRLTNLQIYHTNHIKKLGGIEQKNPL